MFFMFLFIYSWTRLINSNYYEVKKDNFQDSSSLAICCNKGRLGNQMSTYAALLGLSALNNRTPYAQHCNIVYLQPYFLITAKEIYNLPNETREYQIARFLRSEDYHIPSDKKVLCGHKNPNSYTFYHHIKEKIKKEFQIKTHILNHVQTYLKSLRKHPTAIFVGIHVRQTDYYVVLNKYHRNKVNLQYFREAMEYFRIKYNDVIFLVVSDDRKWCKKNLDISPDVIITPASSKPAYDMALLTQCNHTIITYGSFGFWSAYLGNGETVYFSGYLPKNPEFLKDNIPLNKQFPPEWIGLDGNL
ncbi:galactoside 2-alpha-L-fucosyltransferase 2-like [Centruroides sculpturatus]|uniref:galactoside 2-alpha-L-fucosyltransferase 2-like n=1 Tax=Centruroides sculpturatus TaxID=218467 RepID=UPI000C6CDBF3|nr:galactoside 2-alpha-L-fucosyltransferase 2-like [Centruroides sculpturatus]